VSANFKIIVLTGLLLFTYCGCEKIETFPTWQATEQGVGAVDTEGNVVIPFIYEVASPFFEGLAAVKRGDKWGFIDGQGQTAIPFQYDYAFPFKDGYAPVMISSQMGDGKWGFVDKSNKPITSFIFSVGTLEIEKVALSIEGKNYGDLIEKVQSQTPVLSALEIAIDEQAFPYLKLPISQGCLPAISSNLKANDLEMMECFEMIEPGVYRYRETELCGIYFMDHKGWLGDAVKVEHATLTFMEGCLSHVYYGFCTYDGWETKKNNQSLIGIGGNPIIQTSYYDGRNDVIPDYYIWETQSQTIIIYPVRDGSGRFRLEVYYNQS